MVGSFHPGHEPAAPPCLSDAGVAMTEVLRRLIAAARSDVPTAAPRLPSRYEIMAAAGAGAEPGAAAGASISAASGREGGRPSANHPRSEARPSLRDGRLPDAGLP